MIDNFLPPPLRQCKVCSKVPDSLSDGADVVLSCQCDLCTHSARTASSSLLRRGLGHSSCCGLLVSKGPGTGGPQWDRGEKPNKSPWWWRFPVQLDRRYLLPPNYYCTKPFHLTKQPSRWLVFFCPGDLLYRLFQIQPFQVSLACNVRHAPECCYLLITNHNCMTCCACQSIIPLPYIN